MTISPLAAFKASTLQHTPCKLCVRDIVLQCNSLQIMKRIATDSTFCVPPAGIHSISILFFADVARPNESGQIGNVSGILIGEAKNGSISHILTWSPRLSGRPVKPSGSPKVLAAGDASDEGCLLCDFADQNVKYRCTDGFCRRLRGSVRLLV